MRQLSIDVESYSSADLSKTGVYPYVEAPDFELLLIGYRFDDQSETTVIETAGMTIEEAVWYVQIEYPTFYWALHDKDVLKTAFNANFERQTLGRYFGYMEPEQWQCTMVRAAMLGLPLSLAGVGEALGLGEDKKKLSTGRALIQYFSRPCKPTKANGGRRRNMPEHAPEKWQLFVEYNARDVDSEREIMRKLDEYGPMDPNEQALWCWDQRTNDHGVLLDLPYIRKILEYDAEKTEERMAESIHLTGLQNPNSIAQLKQWLAEQGVEMPGVTKAHVAEALARDDLPLRVRRVLELRQALGKTSTKKYQAMVEAVCMDGRARGILQFYGANRTGRWSGRNIQIQNLPQNHIDDIEFCRELVADGDFDAVEMCYGDTAPIFSQLVRTAFIASPGCRFVVCDFSAIEARVIAWLAGEQWVLDAFQAGKDIYCETASMMYKVPVVKHGENGHLRQKGKVATLACSYGGGIGAMKAMDSSGSIPEDELQGAVDMWRVANPRIVKLWRSLELGAKKAIQENRPKSRPVKVPAAQKILFYMQGGALFMVLPSGRRLCYWEAKVVTMDDGRDHITYAGVNQETKQWTRAETWGGKLSENCLAGDTLILTNSGWKPIREIGPQDLLWDGVEWVRHYGLIMHDKRQTITVDGVRMTPDHQVLTEEGWQNASACSGYHRPYIWLPFGDQLRRVERPEESVEREMQCLRENGSPAGKRSTEGKAEVLRMHEVQDHLGKEHEPRDVWETDLERMAFHEAEMRKSESAGLEQLRRKRNQCVPEVVGKFRGILSGHGAGVQPGTDARQDRCERELRAGELPMGHISGAGKEHPEEPDNRYTVGADDSNRGIGTVRDRRNDAALQAGPRDHGRFSVCETGFQEYVYDIRSAGPRSRFTVQSDAGVMIVHNCTQAAARDCLAVALLRVADLGYQVVMHVHDEMIVDVPNEDRDAYQKISKAMGTPPDWAPGLPLRGDGYETPFYMKD